MLHKITGRRRSCSFDDGHIEVATANDKPITYWELNGSNDMNINSDIPTYTLKLNNTQT